MKIIKKMVILICVCPLFYGCIFFSMDRRDMIAYSGPSIDKAEALPETNSCVIIGNITGLDEYSRTIAVIAVPVNNALKQNHDYIILDEPGEFMMYIPEGLYNIYTVADKNNNSIFEKSEVNGVYGTPETVTLNSGDVRTGVNIESGKLPADFIPPSAEINIAFNYNSIVYQSRNGQERKIYSEIFSPQNASAGWSSPSLFMKAYGANIYLTEKYDPDRIPVLFVHGAKGSPQDWVYFFIRMDKKLYQPLFYYYPSGLRLPLISKMLYEKLKQLQERYRFKEMYLAAHSMGGLITRSLLTEYDFEKQNDYVKIYVTFATPWSGFSSADNALETSPVVLPGWIDVGSRSLFIQKTLRKKLPDSIDYYLFFGKNDSTSQGRALDERAYMGAKGKFGFDADHSTILSDRDVFLKFNEILPSHEHN